MSAEKAGVDQPIMQLQFVQCLRCFCIWGNNFRNDDRLELEVAWESIEYSPLQWEMRA